MNVAFAALRKVDLPQGLVYGIAAAEVPDKSGEVMDYFTSKPNFKKWADEFSKATGGRSLGNVREMHQPSAVGKLTAIDFDDESRQIPVVAKITDPTALQKCVEGVYTGFSIGGSYAKVWQDGKLRRYTAVPTEISLVDNPCVPTAHFLVVKRDGTRELRKFAAEGGGRMQLAEEVRELAKSDPVAAMRKIHAEGATPAAPAEGDVEPHDRGLRDASELESSRDCEIEIVKSMRENRRDRVPALQARLRELRHEEAARLVGA